MPIVKDGAWIAIDSVEHDGAWFKGTGRPGDPLQPTDAWQETLTAWQTVGQPPIATDNEFYGIKNGAWVKFDGAQTVDVKAGVGLKSRTVGDNTYFDLNVTASDGTLDFTKEGE